MHVALICPYSGGPARGNITTVRRIAEHLPTAGCQVTVIPLDIMASQGQQAQLLSAKPDLLHAFHAFHAGPAAMAHAQRMHLPYLITITGSDLFKEQMRNALSTRSVIDGATAITCFDPLVAEQLATYFPAAAAKIVVIAQGVAPLPLHKKRHYNTGNPDCFTLLLPAAIRPEKGILEAIAALHPLVEIMPNLRLLLAGGGLDPLYAETVRRQVHDLPWITLLGDVPHESMGELYATADLVLNCSLFEGGMANALLEAMAMGRPVLARDITGNRSLIKHGITGWLYKNDEQLPGSVLDIAARPEQRARVGRAAKDFVIRHFSPEQEAEALMKLYQKLLT